MSKKHSPPKKDNRAGLLIISVVLVLFGLSIAFIHRWKTVQQANAIYPLKVWDQGQEVSSKNISFRVNSVRTDVADVPGYWELPDGMQFAVLNVTLANKMDYPYQLSPIQTMYIQGADNKRYGVSSAPSITLPFGGELAAGQSVTGEVGLIVPKDLGAAQFMYDPHTPGDPLIITSVKL